MAAAHMCNEMQNSSDSRQCSVKLRSPTRLHVAGSQKGIDKPRSAESGPLLGKVIDQSCLDIIVFYSSLQKPVNGGTNVRKDVRLLFIIIQYQPLCAAVFTYKIQKVFSLSVSLVGEPESSPPRVRGLNLLPRTKISLDCLFSASPDPDIRADQHSF